MYAGPETVFRAVENIFPWRGKLCAHLFIYMQGKLIHNINIRTNPQGFGSSSKARMVPNQLEGVALVTTIPGIPHPRFETTKVPA